MLGEEDEKPIVDITQVRADIVKELMSVAPEAQQLRMEFLTKNPPVGIDLEDLSRRIRIGNRRFLRGDDTEGLVTDEEILYVARMNRYLNDGYSFMNEPHPDDVSCTQVDAGGVSAEWQDCSSPSMDKVILYFHGGGYIMGSIKSHRCMTLPIGRVCNARILSVDYRLAPEHPYPAQLDDAVKVYQWLIDTGIQLSNVVLMGFSAGGGISLSLIVKLHDLGIELPAGIVLKSPGIDFSVSESMRTNAPLDPAIGDAGFFMMRQAFIGNADPKDPLVSPIYADPTLFPPLLLQVGSNEMLYDQGRMFVEKAKAAGVNATFQEFPDMVHGWYGMEIPEAKDAIEKIGVFVRGILTT
ncbi:MAG: alpha/beta hydrolase [Candidatus Thorarchaeota archaeon]